MPEMISLDDTGYLVMVRVYDENEFKAEWYATLPEAVARQSEVRNTTGEKAKITTPANQLRKLAHYAPYSFQNGSIVGESGAPGPECPTSWTPGDDGVGL